MNHCFDMKRKPEHIDLDQMEALYDVYAPTEKDLMSKSDDEIKVSADRKRSSPDITKHTRTRAERRKLNRRHWHKINRKWSRYHKWYSSVGLCRKVIDWTEDSGGHWYPVYAQYFTRLKSNRKKLLKKKASRAIRRSNVMGNGSYYKKVFDLPWELD